MIIKQVACDHCGKPLDTMKDYDDLDIVMNHVTIKADLCDACFKGLNKYIKDYVNAAKVASKSAQKE